ncbi:phospholipase C, phosphocholine-specific [Amnibacterium sp. CER49]|uniref:phosphocholine-specific phospholipase C n=1 Tax=Amnibacterium sp. CER49 TaxID=3039161 RepID=UPI002448744A|nr:phospholipase C, phosphocholine-specific [Amnibacterium sp. CER49]MDH2443346.1 phospholipase C, phosphocholine-specific [Amnibacterium sp. CER49]
MGEMDRRRFLQVAGAGVASAAIADMLGQSVARAATIPANRATRSIRDVEHVVVFMQENRAFDHYFGTLRGVRGFADPHPALLPSGRSAFHQNNGTRDVLPYRPTAPNLGMQFMEDLDHSWKMTHEAFNGGRYDRWLPAKSDATMAYYGRQDIPFHFALADAFTVCDQYHCSVLGPTDPNRYYMFTGGDDPERTGGGPDLWNDEKGYWWGTYPEQLEKAGVSWKVYQDVGDGLDANGYWGWTGDAYVGNYGDNSLLYFKQYQEAQPGSALYEKARTGTDAAAGGDLFSILRGDVAAGKLPQVSYIVAPEAYTEHSNWPPNFGAWYMANVLDILTSNADVWSKTAVFLMYDENDGFFDHVVPPHPNTPRIPGASTVSTAGEWYDGTPTAYGSSDVPGHFGLGVRVPMLVISPWSMGGWVCSETFDHTSIVRFLEKRFGVRSPNITPWRRAVCGDLTSAFDFAATGGAAPALPPTASYAPTDHERHDSYVPTPPAVNSMPSQERGTRPSRPLGYALDAVATKTGAVLSVRFANPGSLGAHVQVRSDLLPQGPYSYTIGAGASLDASWPLGAEYDVQMHGPAGWYRRLAGTTGAADIRATVTPAGSSPNVRFRIENTGSAAVSLRVKDAYRGSSEELSVGAGGTRTLVIPTHGGWYDLTVTSTGDPRFLRELAGRLENGHPLTSDPQLGA